MTLRAARRSTVRLVVLLGSGGLAGCPAPPVAHPEARPTGGTVTDSLKDLLGLLGRSLGAEELARAIGAVEKDYGGNLQIAVRPRDPAVARVEVIRRPDGPPSSIDLELARPLAVSELRGAFGDFTRPPALHFDAPAEIVFSPPAPLAGCHLIARVDGDGAPEAGTITHLTLRRDAR